MKLSKKQAEVIRLLQKGEVLITDERRAGVSNGKQYIPIHLRVFRSLEKKGLIFQNPRKQFDFELTELGKEFPISADHSQ